MRYVLGVIVFLVTSTLVATSQELRRFQCWNPNDAVWLHRTITKTGKYHVQEGWKLIRVKTFAPVTTTLPGKEDGDWDAKDIYCHDISIEAREESFPKQFERNELVFDAECVIPLMIENKEHKILARTNISIDPERGECSVNSVPVVWGRSSWPSPSAHSLLRIMKTVSEHIIARERDGRYKP